MPNQGEKLLPRGTADCLKKRRLLNEKDLSPALCQEYGEKFFELGWWEDSRNFLRKAAILRGWKKSEPIAWRRNMRTC